jgi:hypothetical protein
MPSSDALFDAAFTRLSDPELSQPPSSYLRAAGKMAKDLGQSVLDAVRLPGQVAGGEFAVKPETPGMWSEEDEYRQQRAGNVIESRAKDLAGFVTGGGYSAPAQRNATGMGIRAYHGSPHDFDRFDLSKIGTGEGAQVYGHGLYFAENEAVAKAYRDALAGKSLSTEAGKIEPKAALDLMSRRIAEKLPDFGQPSQASVWVFNRLHSGKAAGEIEKDIASMAWDAGQKDAARVALDAARGWKTNPRMYEVDINARPEQFLDWDKPLSKQPGEVRSALANLGIKHDPADARAFDDALLSAMQAKLCQNSHVTQWVASYTVEVAQCLKVRLIRCGRRLFAKREFPASNILTKGHAALVRGLVTTSCLTTS